MADIFASLDPFLEPGEVMGRKTANEGFLRALLRADPFDSYHFFPAGERVAGGLAARLEKEFPEHHARGAFMVLERRGLPEALARNDYHCFHLSDCINAPALLAALRNRAGREVFPITSITHSLSYAGYGRAFLSHLWPGTTARDCVVATSRAAAKVVDNYYDMLAKAYALAPEVFRRPAVERIPLGVDVAEMRPPEPRERQSARLKLGCGESETVLLIFGRLSHHSKMDLLPLFRAIQRIFSREVDPSGLRLLLAGWGQEERMLNVYREVARNIGLNLTIRLRPDEAEKRELFAAADVFVSPVDNPQETFGIAMLEAGAFGLPAVASDYDGYRDIVVHGETGFLAPVRGVSTTDGVNAEAPLAFDTATHLRLAQRTAVDVSALAEGLLALVRDPELGRVMGRAARRRVEADFSWAAVVEKHLALWDDLWSRPVDPEAASHWRHPQMIDYAEVFAGHPSRALGVDEVLVATRTGNAVYRGRDNVLIHEGLGRDVSIRAIKRLLFEARKPRPAGELIGVLDKDLGLGAESAEANALWALKHDLLEVVTDRET